MLISFVGAVSVGTTGRPDMLNWSIVLGTQKYWAGGRIVSLVGKGRSEAPGFWLEQLSG